jgi:hypothetical protein
MITKKIYCCGCLKDVDAELTSGQGVYPNCKESLQAKLWILPFWRCPNCKNFVGCHHKTKDMTRPLGCIPTKEIKNARQHIHKLIDPLWENHVEPFRARGWIYRWLAAKMGKKEYHTAEIRSVEEAREIYRHAQKIKSAEDCRNVN